MQRGKEKMPFDYSYTCTKCRKKWDVYKMHSPSRDKDSEHCDCGELIVKWNGGVIYTVRAHDNNRDEVK